MLERLLSNKKLKVAAKLQGVDMRRGTIYVLIREDNKVRGLFRWRKVANRFCYKTLLKSMRYLKSAKYSYHFC